MRRTMAILATVALSAAAFFAAAAPASASGSVNVTPSTNLAGDTVVTVSWTGLTPNGTPSIVQCKNSPTTGAGGADCEFLTLQVAGDASNGSGAGSDTFVVRDSNGLLALNPRTEVRCDASTSGSIAVLDNPNDLNSGATKTISCVGAVPVVPTTHDLVSCTGTSLIAKPNPALGSNSAKYTKIAASKSKGDKTEFGTNAAIPADATTCAVDSGIRNENPTSDSTKPNPFDNQTNLQSTLTTSNVTSKVTMVLSGSASCQTEAQATVNNAYPQAYPLQGKLIMSFNQTNALGKQIKLLGYIHLGKDAADPDPSHFIVRGSVFSGPGIGAEIQGTIRMAPTSFVKNINPGECTDSDVTDDANDASITEMAVTLADGSDQDTTVDPLKVVIPS